MIFGSLLFLAGCSGADLLSSEAATEAKENKFQPALNFVDRSSGNRRVMGLVQGETIPAMRAAARFLQVDGFELISVDPQGSYLVAVRIDEANRKNFGWLQGSVTEDLAISLQVLETDGAGDRRLQGSWDSPRGVAQAGLYDRREAVQTLGLGYTHDLFLRLEESGFLARPNVKVAVPQVAPTAVVGKVPDGVPVGSAESEVQAQEAVQP